MWIENQRVPHVRERCHGMYKSKQKGKRKMKKQRQWWESMKIKTIYLIATYILREKRKRDQTSMK